LLSLIVDAHVAADQRRAVAIFASSWIFVFVAREPACQRCLQAAGILPASRRPGVEFLCDSPVCTVCRR
jgi:hypothetical protein